MSKLEGKKVRIDGDTFTVRSQFSNPSENIETLILTKEIHESESPVGDIDHACDLDYESIGDIQYSDSEMEFANIHVKEKAGEIFDIAYVTPDGVLKEMSIEITGINWENPDEFDIIFYTEDEGANKQTMTRDLLLRSYLLYHEWKGDFIPDSKCDPDMPDEISDDIIDDMEASGIDVDSMPDEVKEAIREVIGDDDPADYDIKVKEIKTDRKPKPQDIDMPGELADALKDIVKGFMDAEDTDVSFEGQPIKKYKRKVKTKRSRGPSKRDIDRLKKELFDSDEGAEADELLQNIFDSFGDLFKGK